ncbi:MAG TPA: hypothetical protein VFA49_04770, partial [Chloroflexota bacterium]|nr:hypothetical protein [Chloroflexota bacterium]
MPSLSHADLILFVTCVGLALGISATLTPLVGRWARAHSIVANPRQDRWHKEPTPLLGGVTIYVATTLVLLNFVHLDTRLIGLVAGGTLLFAAG